MAVNALLEVFHHKKLLLSMLLMRLVCVFVVQSSFVPDEYWQSLEIAHKSAFGYGYVTWEWIYGIRSFFYPFWFAAVYKMLYFLGLDSPDVLVILPRIMQATLSAFSDVCFVRWISKLVKNNAAAHWIITMWFTIWFVNYTSTRTLTNTLELNLTMIGLYLYPWNNDKGNHSFLWFVGLACLARPTAVIQWFPLCLYNVLKSPNSLRQIFTLYFVRIIQIVILSICIDYVFYEKIVLTPLNFILYNGRNNIGEHYGVHSIFWYISSGIPVVLGPVSLLFYHGMLKTGKDVLTHYKNPNDTSGNVINNILFITVLWSLVWYSAVPHKEFRFILPLTPMMMYISSVPLSGLKENVLTTFTKPNILFNFISIGIIVTNLVLLVYMGLWHQIGPITVASSLAKIAKEDPVNSNFLFLTPCHSTPLYSHIHLDVKTNFLTCEPNLFNEENYKDESDRFFEEPLTWLMEHYPFADCSLPSHVILFSNLESEICHFLDKYKYTLEHSIFHAHVTQGRQSEYIKIFKLNWRKPKNCYSWSK